MLSTRKSELSYTVEEVIMYPTKKSKKKQQTTKEASSLRGQEENSEAIL